MNHARRQFLQTASALSAAPLLGWSNASRAQPAPEVTKVRFVRTPALCFVPQFIAEEFLLLEGFTEVQQIEVTTIPDTLVKSADFAMFGGPSLLPPIDRGMPIVTLAGTHIGCWELFAHDNIHSMRDLRGKKVAVAALGSVEHIWLSSILAYVGIDPRKDIEWVLSGHYRHAARLFVERQADAFLAFPPQPQEMRELGVGHVLVNTTTDRPYSNYICCMWAGHRNFVERYPVATKRVVRAILKANDVCANDPERAARYIVEKGYTERYKIALEIVKELPFNRWREMNPEDSLRFHALRLHEVGMIKADPNTLIARGTDWRFLDELKRELKA